MSTRVYLPSTVAGLKELLVSGGLGADAPTGYAVTEELRNALPDAGEEEWEYAALTTAAQASLGLGGVDDDPRRVVVVAEADSCRPVDDGEPGLVRVDEAVPLRRVAAVHVDSDEAAEDVAAARAAWSRATEGDPSAVAVVERCLDHELGWYATQELGLLVGG